MFKSYCEMLFMKNILNILLNLVMHLNNLIALINF